MPSRPRILLLALALLAATVLVGPTAGRAEPATIFAAASTTDALGAALRRFETQSDTSVRSSFAASSTLAKQIDAGAPAQLFLSANVAWMDWLQARGRIVEGSRSDILGNELVLIVPAAAPALDSLAALPAYLDGERLALGDPAHVPAGRYARAALEHAGLWRRLSASMAFAGDVRAALALVARGEARAGVVYATDARISDDVRVALRLPADGHPPIRYPLALVAGKATPESRVLHDFLRGPEAARVFRAHGFRVLGAAPRS